MSNSYTYTLNNILFGLATLGLARYFLNLGIRSRLFKLAFILELLLVTLAKFNI